MESTGNVTATAQPAFNATLEMTNPFAAAVISVLAVVGIVGNSLVVYIVVKCQDMHSATNIYICNLARADICFLVVCALPAASQLVNAGVWTLGDFTCRFAVYVQSVSVQATVGTFTAMTVDRCAVIFNPLTSRTRRTNRAVRITILLIWITSCLMHLPVVLFYGVVLNPSTMSPVCTYIVDHDTKFVVYSTYEVLVMYFLPLAVIGTSNVSIALRVNTAKMPANMQKCSGGRRTADDPSRRTDTPGVNGRISLQRRGNTDTNSSGGGHVTAMVLVIIVFFGICWGPTNVLRLYMLYSKKEYNYDLIFNIHVVALCLSYFNSAANPVLYAFLGRNFRQHLRRIFQRCFRIRRRQCTPSHYQATPTTRRTNTQRTY